MGEYENLPPLPEEFYLRGTVTVAKELLGKVLVIRQGRQTLAVELVEVEAYLHDDPASHSFRGPSPRNGAMFERGGICYVYLCYGVHYCINVVTGPKGKGEAVLLRAAIPLVGLDWMTRQRRAGAKPVDLTNGPGKLTQALGINLQHNGLGFHGRSLKIVDAGKQIMPALMGVSPRIGISQAKGELLRFYVRDCPWVCRNVRKT